jgi:hypothetical protein
MIAFLKIILATILLLFTSITTETICEKECCKALKIKKTNAYSSPLSSNIAGGIIFQNTDKMVTNIPIYYFK